MENIAEASREYSKENSRNMSQASIKALNKEENDIIQSVIEEQDIEQENYITPRPLNQTENFPKKDAETPYFDTLAKQKFNVGNRINKNANVTNFSTEKKNNDSKSPNPFSSNKHNYSISSASSQKFMNSKSKSPQIKKLLIEETTGRENLQNKLSKPNPAVISKYSNKDTQKKQSIQNFKNKTPEPHQQAGYNFTLSSNLINIANLNSTEKMRNTASNVHKNKQPIINKPIPKTTVDNTSLTTSKQANFQNKHSKANSIHNQNKSLNNELKNNVEMSSFTQFLLNSSILKTLDNLNESQCIQELDDAVAKISVKYFLVLYNFLIYRITYQ